MVCSRVIYKKACFCLMLFGTETEVPVKVPRPADPENELKKKDVLSRLI
jgi:hypothetical protein